MQGNPNRRGGKKKKKKEKKKTHEKLDIHRSRYAAHKTKRKHHTHHANRRKDNEDTEISVPSDSR